MSAHFFPLLPNSSIHSVNAQHNYKVNIIHRKITIASKEEI
jgi:hypothetical protein